MPTRIASITLVGFLLGGCNHDAQPERRAPATQDLKPVIPAFDGDHAFRFLTRQTDFGPRNPGSPGQAACLRYFLSTLSGLADTTRAQPFQAAGYDGERLELTNVIASFRPAEEHRLLLCAHWDTRPRAEFDEDRTRRDRPILGANDGASGVAVLLELASLMKHAPPPIGVDIVLFDGEDFGKEGDHDLYLLGSRHYARSVQPGETPRFGIVLDMVGDAFLEIPKEKNSLRLAPDVVNLIWNTARQLGIPQFVDDPGEEVLDDHIPLNEAGIPTADLIDFNYPDQTHRFWHTHQDTPDHCSAESLEAVGTVVTHVVYGQRP
jgi:hypothetical protein